MGGLSVCAYDLETSNLNANFGIVLCGVIRDLNTGEETIIRWDELRDKRDPANDRRVCVGIRDKLSEFDIMVGYNSVLFDVRFLNTRLLSHREKMLPDRPVLKHIDLFFRAKYNLRLHSASLDAVAKFLHLDNQKTLVDGGMWVRALTGDKKAMDYIVEHCILDVRVLGEAFDLLKQFVREIR